MLGGALYMIIRLLRQADHVAPDCLFNGENTDSFSVSVIPAIASSHARIPRRESRCRCLSSWASGWTWSDDPGPSTICCFQSFITFTMTLRSRGPSNSQKNKACQVPSARRPSSTSTGFDTPIMLVLICAAELPSLCP